MTLRIHTYLTADLRGVPEQARQAEALGFDGVLYPETGHDPFLPLALAAEHTSRLGLATGVAIALARNPMLLATTAHDLNAASGGRFTLGLGSQVKAHIMRRYSMPWSQPAARMQEMIAAIRAIFACWYDGVTLDFRGQFYTHTLMSPVFSPADTAFGRPPIGLAAVGPEMTRVAGAAADVLFLHSFATEDYVRQQVLPMLAKGLREAERRDDACRVHGHPFLVTGRDEAELERTRRVVAKRIAFYASTPQYRRVLDVHGWGDVQPLLQALAQRGRWDEMGALITPEMLDTMAVVGEPAHVARLIWNRYGNCLDDLSLASEVVPMETLAEIATEIRRLSGTAGK